MMPDRDVAGRVGVVGYGTTEGDAPPGRDTGRPGRGRHGRPRRERRARRYGGRRLRGVHAAGRFSQAWSAGTPHPRRLLRWGNGLVAVTASGALLAVLGAGFGTVPALGPAVVPAHGVWGSAPGGELPGSQTLTLAGLRAPAHVSVSKQSVPA